MTAPITIVDYGIGNVASIANMLAKAGYASVLSADPDQVVAAEKLLLPGVGAFDKAAIRLRETGLRDAVLDGAASGTPVLGVCLGMQLLMDGSEEGVEEGLGLIPGQVRRFPREVDEQLLRVPHMGWNTVHRTGTRDALESVATGDRFYFVHSYFADPSDPADALATTTHGVTFASMISRGNVTGVQFHPEKSHRTGMRLLSGFAA